MLNCDKTNPFIPYRLISAGWFLWQVSVTVNIEGGSMGSPPKNPNAYLYHTFV